MKLKTTYVSDNKLYAPGFLTPTGILYIYNARKYLNINIRAPMLSYQQNTQLILQ